MFFAVILCCFCWFSCVPVHCNFVYLLSRIVTTWKLLLARSSSVPCLSVCVSLTAFAFQHINASSMSSAFTALFQFMVVDGASNITTTLRCICLMFCVCVCHIMRQMFRSGKSSLWFILIVDNEAFQEVWIPRPRHLPNCVETRRLGLFRDHMTTSNSFYNLRTLKFICTYVCYGLFGPMCTVAGNTFKQL